MHRVMDRLQDAALLKVRIVLDLGGVEHGARRNADAADELHCLLLSVLPRPLADDLVDLDLVLDARIHRRITLVTDQIFAPDQLQ